MWPPPAGHSAGGRWYQDKNGDEIMSRGIRYALIVTAMAFAWVAGSPAPSQAAPQGDAAATSSKPLALGKFTKHRKKRARHHVRPSRKHHQPRSKASSRSDTHDEAKVDKTEADKPLPPSVANAHAELTGDTPDQPPVATDSTADASTLTEADKAATTGIAPNGVQVTTSDQLNEMDRDAAAPAATPAAPPEPATVALAQIAQPAVVSANEESAWSSASLIGKIFIAFGVMLTLASAARMLWPQRTA
jgi:hypothetical protein